MRTRNLVLSLISISIIVGCGPTSNKFSRAELSSRAKTEMIGMSKGEILGCMGPPEQSAQHGSTEVWSYFAGGDVDTYTNAYANPTYNGAYVTGTSSSKVRSCQVNLLWAGDQVSQISFQGRTGGLVTEGEQCAFAISQCVK